jgi:hypothetical protein
MNSKTEIANAALTEVGANPITDLDSDTTTQGVVVRRWYAHTKDLLLRHYTWNFSLARQALSQDATGPSFEFSNSYTLPTDPYCLRALSMYNSSSEWKVEGRKLLTDDSSVNLKYVSRVSNPVEFDDLFTDALIFRLAANIAFPIMRDRLLVRELLVIYEAKIQEARTADAQEGTFNVMRNRVLTVVRRGIDSPPSTPVSGSGTSR